MDQSLRPPVITGNWKMHKTLEEALLFAKGLIPLVENYATEIGLAVPFTLIHAVKVATEGSNLLIGAQNMNDASEGAFTGEVASRMLRDAGAEFVLLGHSERRYLFNEDNAFINRKIKRALSDGLRPVLCIGETEEEHRAGLTHEVLRTQLTECLAGIEPHGLHSLGIAYEPVWAIGTGIGATPEIAQEAQHFCRQVLGEMIDQETASRLIIQYGGSVNPSNALDFLNQPDIDGLLIGGASLSLESFSQIINHSESLLNRKDESI
jgi:triosephosphate isomerase